MSDPRDEQRDDELARLLRASLIHNADDAPDASRMADRALARLAEQPSRRNRSWRRAGAPLVAAASVAAVVAAGLIGTLIVHHRQEHSDAAASRRSQQQLMSQQSVTVPSTSQSPNRATPTSPTTSSPTAEALPAGFRLRDLSFVNSGTIAYAVGEICPTDNGCTSSVVAESDNGGADWTVASRDSFPVGTGFGDVTSVRFESPSYGYAYGPGVLYRTTDAGHTWSSMNAGGAVALEASRGSVLRVTASAADCSTGCAYSLSSSQITDTDWSAVKGAPTAKGTRAFLARTGSDVYFAAVNGSTSTVYSSADDGQAWSSGTAVCAGSSLVSLASAQDKSVVALCAAKTSAWVQVSVNQGTTFSPSGLSAPAAVATGGTPAVAAFDRSTILVSADRLYRSTDGGRQFTPVRTDAGATKKDRVVFLGTESDTSARWVCGNGSTVWTSADTGATWSPHDF